MPAVKRIYPAAKPRVEPAPVLRPDPPRRRHPHRAQLLAALAAVVWLAGFIQTIVDYIFDRDE